MPARCNCIVKDSKGIPRKNTMSLRHILLFLLPYLAYGVIEGEFEVHGMKSGEEHLLAEPIPKPPVGSGDPADDPEVIVTGGLTGEEEYPIHVRVMEKKDVEREERERQFKFTQFLVKHATPGCQEELDDVMALDNSTAAPPGRSTLFSEECDEEFDFVSVRVLVRACVGVCGSPYFTLFFSQSSFLPPPLCPP